MQCPSVISTLNDRLNETFERCGEYFRRHAKTILRTLTALVMFFLTEKLLTIIPFFPYRWVVFISAVSAFSALRSKSLSFTITWVALSVSLAYQNPVLGGIAFLIYAFASPSVFSCTYLDYLIYTSAIYLIFYGLEFFPIVFAALTYNAKKAVKVSLVTFFSGFALCSLLPVSTLGHVTLDFSTSIVLKPPVSSVSLSSIVSSVLNVSGAGEFETFVSRLLSGVANSQQFVVLLVGWLLIAAIPAYVKDAVRKYGHVVTLLALLISSYVPFLAVSFVYPVSGFTSVFNVLSFAAMVAVAWFLSEIVLSSIRIQRASDRTAAQTIQQTPVDAVISQDFVSQNTQEQADQTQIPGEGSRINALMRELGTGRSADRECEGVNGSEDGEDES